eukprot:2302507-Ditylum_brightwellii.AAC.1
MATPTIDKEQDTTKIEDMDSNIVLYTLLLDVWVNQTHKGTNCNNKADDHQDNATLDNHIGGSNCGISHR